MHEARAIVRKVGGDVKDARERHEAVGHPRRRRGVRAALVAVAVEPAAPREVQSAQMRAGTLRGEHDAW